MRDANPCRAFNSKQHESNASSADQLGVFPDPGQYAARFTDRRLTGRLHCAVYAARIFSGVLQCDDNRAPLYLRTGENVI